MGRTAVITVGNEALKYAENFKTFSQYDFVKSVLTTAALEQESLSESEIFLINYQNNPEDFERCFPEARAQQVFGELDGPENEVTVVICGAETISAVCLRLIKIFNRAKITILYIKPFYALLEDKKLNEKIVFNALQEYARSGKFERIFLVDYKLVDKTLSKELPAKEYLESRIKQIVNAYHTFNICTLGDNGILNTTFAPPKPARISTLGCVLLEDEYPFSVLEGINYKGYFFLVNEKAVETEGGLIQKIQEKVEKRGERGVLMEYDIFPSQHATDFIYIVACSEEIQQQ